MNKLFKSVAIVTLFSILTRFLAFVFKVIISRNISPETLGIYTISISIFVVLATLISSGLPVTISRLTASFMVQNKKDKLWKTISCGMIISLIASVILCLIIVLCKNFITMFADNLVYTMILYMLPAVIFSAIYASIKGYLWGMEKYLSVSAVELFEQIIRILFCVALFYWTSTFETSLIPSITLSIACFASTAFGVVLYFVHKGKLTTPTHHYKTLLCASIPITAVRTANSFLSPLINIILPVRLMACGYTKNQSLAQLGTFMGMTMPLLSIPSTMIGSLAMVLIPQIAILHGSNQTNTLSKQISSAIKFTILCCMLCLPVYLSLGTLMGNLLFDNIQAGIYLSTSAWIIVPTGLAMLTTSILNSLGLEKKTFIYFLISTTLSLTSLVVLPPLVGMQAVVYSLGIAQIATALLNIRAIKKSLHISIPIVKPIVYQGCIALAVTILGKFLYNICILLFPNIVTLLIIATVCVIAFVLLAITFQQLDITYIKNSLQSKKSKLRV